MNIKWKLIHLDRPFDINFEFIAFLQRVDFFWKRQSDLDKNVVLGYYWFIITINATKLSPSFFTQFVLFCIKFVKCLNYFETWDCSISHFKAWVTFDCMKACPFFSCLCSSLNSCGAISFLLFSIQFFFFFFRTIFSGTVRQMKDDPDQILATEMNSMFEIQQNILHQFETRFEHKQLWIPFTKKKITLVSLSVCLVCPRYRKRINNRMCIV